MQKSALCSILFCSGSMVKQKVARDLGLSIGDNYFPPSCIFPLCAGASDALYLTYQQDDDDLLAAFIEISEDRDDMGDVVEAMRAEVAAN